jgi:hypothetical protein
MEMDCSGLVATGLTPVVYYPEWVLFILMAPETRISQGQGERLSII